MTGTDRSRTRGPYAKTAQTRRGILDACVAAFSELGFQGASMADIARRSGISHTGLLHHFPTKEQLLIEMLEAHDHETGAFLASRPAAEDLAPSELIDEMAQTLRHRPQLTGITELSAMLSAEAVSAEHPAHDYFAARYSGVRHYLAFRFGLLRSRGALRSRESDEQLAAMTISLLEGLEKQALYGSEIDAEATVAAFLRSLIAAAP